MAANHCCFCCWAQNDNVCSCRISTGASFHRLTKFQSSRRALSVRGFRVESHYVLVAADNQYWASRLMLGNAPLPLLPLFNAVRIDSKGQFVASPSLVKLPNGRLLAALERCACG